MISEKDDIEYVVDLETKVKLADEREKCLKQVLDKHGAPTHEKHTGFKLNFVGRTDDLLYSLEKKISELEDKLEKS